MSDFDGIHGGVTDEMLENFFNDNPDLRPLAPVNGHGPTDSTTQFAAGEGQTTTPPGGVEQDAGGADDGAAAPPPAPAPPEEDAGAGEGDASGQPPSPPVPDDFIEFDEGLKLPRSQATAAARFQKMLAGDPAMQKLLTDYLAGGEVTPPPATGAGSSVPAPEPLQPPEDLDLEDPSTRALWTALQQSNQRYDQLAQGLQATIDTQLHARRVQSQGQYEVAASSFAKDNNLQREEVDYLSQVAARLGVLPQLMQGIDPVTGSPVRVDEIGAMQRALEIAMYQVPEYRDRAFRTSVDKMRQENEKRKKLGAVGGSSGSVARTTAPPKPGSPEAKQAMLQEVGAMISGDWSDPTAN